MRHADLRSSARLIAPLVALTLLAAACRSAPPAPPFEPDPGVWEAAAARGVDFRAVGNEPGWFLELEDGVQIVLVTDYGSRRYTMPAVEPEIDDTARRVVFRSTSGGRDLTLVLSPGPCEDTMSGERFENSVTVTIDGETLQGCGRPLS